MTMMWAAIPTGRHQAVSKRASGMEIFKPGKDGDPQLKANHSISLFSCIGIELEHVVAMLQKGADETRGLLSDGQFGSRTGWLTINAAANMVDRLHAAWTNSHITQVHLIDMKAAFPCVGN